jgi:excinuclease UvrABC nuclease subunit
MTEVFFHRLLTKIRDEARHFTLSYHKKLRNANLLK